jgi:hypothetical protein
MATAYLGVSVLLYILARYNVCNIFSLLPIIIVVKLLNNNNMLYVKLSIIYYKSNIIINYVL